MKMLKLEFSGNTADEINTQVKDYATKIKGSRGGKAGDDEAATGNAPAPMQPPASSVVGFQPGGFAPPAGGAAPMGGAFPAANAGPAPEVVALVQRISSRIDWCLQPPPAGGGQQPDAILAWFKSQLGTETANYTLDQIKQVALPRAAVPTLEGIAKLMAA
jgi:hypothetical protein